MSGLYMLVFMFSNVALYLIFISPEFLFIKSKMEKMFIISKLEGNLKFNSYFALWLYFTTLPVLIINAFLYPNFILIIVSWFIATFIPLIIIVSIYLMQLNRDKIRKSMY